MYVHYDDVLSIRSATFVPIGLPNPSCSLWRPRLGNSWCPRAKCRKCRECRAAQQLVSTAAGSPGPRRGCSFARRESKNLSLALASNRSVKAYSYSTNTL